MSPLWLVFISEDTERHLLGYTNVSNLALIDHFLKLFPGRIRIHRKVMVDDRFPVLCSLVLLECNRPMDEIQVEIVDAQAGKSYVERVLDVGRVVVRVPQLGRYPDI